MVRSAAELTQRMRETHQVSPVTDQVGTGQDGTGPAESDT